jgi:hypothetical protein
MIYRTTLGHNPEDRTVRNYLLMSFFNFPLILCPCIEATEGDHKDGRLMAIKISTSNHVALSAPPPKMELSLCLTLLSLTKIIRNY